MFSESEVNKVNGLKQGLKSTFTPLCLSFMHGDTFMEQIGFGLFHVKLACAARGGWCIAVLEARTLTGIPN